jgi:hypothetical protein
MHPAHLQITDGWTVGVPADEMDQSATLLELQQRISSLESNVESKFLRLEADLQGLENDTRIALEQQAANLQAGLAQLRTDMVADWGKAVASSDHFGIEMREKVSLSQLCW